METTNHNLLMIKSYIEAYNCFDTNVMVKDFSENIIFQNSNSGEINVHLHGIAAFLTQANESVKLFETRNQAITSIKQNGEVYEIDIDYTAKLAQHIGPQLKKGDLLQLKGKSIFEFDNGKIIRITDIS